MESIMEPRLTLLEKILKEKNVLSRSDLIITDHRNIISVLCLLKRIRQNIKRSISILVISENPAQNIKNLSKIKKIKALCFIIEDLPSWTVLRIILKIQQRCTFFLLPNFKSQIEAVATNLVNVFFHDYSGTVKVESISDKTFWVLNKIKQILKSVSIDTKHLARLHLKKLLLGLPALPARKIQKWKINIPASFLEEGTSQLNGKTAWRTGHLKLGLCQVHLTIPFIDEPIYIPKIKLPFFYRLHSICNRLFHENNFLERIRQTDLTTGNTIPHDACVVVVTLNSEKPLPD